MASEKLFYVGIKGLIENSQGKLLLLQASARNHVKNTENYWDIPGGRIEEGQSVLETLQREIQEETGITKIKNPKFFTAVISNHEIPFDNKFAGLVLMIYKVKISENSKINLSPEHITYEWVDKKEAAKRLRYPEEFTAKLAL